ncbi:hypothetical protein [Dapis sp. BLCC M229]|uniref:hypothetical protein n=1 Tax=Dapis sp. BLCC M229 TaxID=3400188 RepID=UPI003CF5CABF
MGNLSDLIENLSNKISDNYQNISNKISDDYQYRRQSDFMRLDADYQDNLRKMENEYHQEIDRIILDLEGRINRLNDYLSDMRNDRPGGYATPERVSGHYEMEDKYKKNLRAFENDIEYLREGKYNDLSKYFLGKVRYELSDITRKQIDNLLDDFESQKTRLRKYFEDQKQRLNY